MLVDDAAVANNVDRSINAGIGTLKVIVIAVAGKDRSDSECQDDHEGEYQRSHHGFSFSDLKVKGKRCGGQTDNGSQHASHDVKLETDCQPLTFGAFGFCGISYLKHFLNCGGAKL